MGKSSGHILTFKDDPEDARRADEIETNYQPRSHKKYDSTPAVKQLRDNEPFIQNDGGTLYVGFRVGGKLYRAELTEVT